MPDRLLTSALPGSAAHSEQLVCYCQAVEHTSMGLLLLPPVEALSEGRGFSQEGEQFVSTQLTIRHLPLLLLRSFSGLQTL